MARITTEQMITVTVAPKTATGKPATIDGEVNFVSSDPTVILVERTSATSARCVAITTGVAQITATFDADMDVGESRELSASGALEVIAAEAETAEIVFGTAEANPGTAVSADTGVVTPDAPVTPTE